MLDEILGNQAIKVCGDELTKQQEFKDCAYQLNKNIKGIIRSSVIIDQETIYKEEILSLLTELVDASSLKMKKEVLDNPQIQNDIYSRNQDYYMMKL